MLSSYSLLRLSFTIVRDWFSHPPEAESRASRRHRRRASCYWTRSPVPLGLDVPVYERSPCWTQRSGPITASTVRRPQLRRRGQGLVATTTWTQKKQRSTTDLHYSLVATQEAPLTLTSPSPRRSGRHRVHWLWDRRSGGALHAVDRTLGPRRVSPSSFRRSGEHGRGARLHRPRSHRAKPQPRLGLRHRKSLNR